MKNIKRVNLIKFSLLIIFILPVLFINSCDDLTEDTRGTLSPESFYKGESDFEAALAGMYRAFSDPFKWAQVQTIMAAGDDITTRDIKADFKNYDTFNYKASNNSAYLFIWQDNYKAIHFANVILAHSENNEVPEEKMKIILGQAHFIRGLSYYTLVRQFGGIPLVKKAEGVASDKKRATVLDTYKLIESDLKYAANNLPESWDKEKGKATSGGAETVLSSLYLTWAGWPVKDDSKYAEAAKWAKKVMDGNRYHLIDNYANLFKAEYDHNPEEIVSTERNNELQEKHSKFGTYIGHGYQPTDVGGYNDTEAELTMFNKFPKNSLRKKETYQTEFTKADGTTLKWQDTEHGHPTFKKWTRSVEEINGKFLSGHNPVIFRYAEVLLTYAEAKAMSEGAPDGSAYSAINKVRKRAELPPIKPGLSKDDFQKKVVQERALEFAGEFTRWFDEVRTETVMQSAKQRSSKDLKLVNQPQNTPEYMLGRIPQQAMNNMPQVANNPEGFKVK